MCCRTICAETITQNDVAVLRVPRATCCFSVAKKRTQRNAHFTAHPLPLHLSTHLLIVFSSSCRPVRHLSSTTFPTSSGSAAITLVSEHDSSSNFGRVHRSETRAMHSTSDYPTTTERRKTPRSSLLPHDPQQRPICMNPQQGMVREVVFAVGTSQWRTCVVGGGDSSVNAAQRNGIVAFLSTATYGVWRRHVP